MEEDASSINPLLLFWQSARVRRHVLTAARELALAAHAGLAELRTQATTSGLTAQYPYLQAALGNLQSTVGQWVGADDTDHTTSPGGKQPAARATPRGARKKAQTNRHESRRTHRSKGR